MSKKGRHGQLDPNHTAGCDALTCICEEKGKEVIVDKEPGNGDGDGWCDPPPLGDEECV